MFTITFSSTSGLPTMTQVRSIDIMPNNDRNMPQSVRINAGIGGGGQLGAGAIVPIADIATITVAEV